METEGSEPKVRGYRVRGRVQGVGFRWWARSIAEDLGIGGTVRNDPDGSVEIHAYGEPEVLERFADMLREGPRFARVDGVEDIDARRIDEPTDFRIEL